MPWDPAQLAAFINPRVLNPEHEHWRRGIEAPVIYARATATSRSPSHTGCPAQQARRWMPKDGRPRSRTSRWGSGNADARRFYARGDMDEDRIGQLEKLGMVWSHFDVAGEEGLAAARG